MVSTAYYDSPIGRLLLAERDGSLIGLWLEGQKYYFDVCENQVKEENTPLLMRSAAWLDRYFAGQRPDIRELQLAPTGTPFRCTVWEILCEIPYGKVMTYGEIANTISLRTGKSRMSARAVGGAVGRNPISIIIPCHRVVGAGGNLTGFSGGIERKISLLSHEGVDMTQFYIPKTGAAL